MENGAEKCQATFWNGAEREFNGNCETCRNVHFDKEGRWRQRLHLAANVTLRRAAQQCSRAGVALVKEGGEGVAGCVLQNTVSRFLFQLLCPNTYSEVQTKNLVNISRHSLVPNSGCGGRPNAQASLLQEVDKNTISQVNLKIKTE